MTDENRNNLIIAAAGAFAVAAIFITLFTSFCVQAWRDVEIAKIKANAQEEVAK